MTTRKVAVVVASRANYGRVRSVLKAIEAHPGLSLQLLLGGSALLARYGNVLEAVEEDGFKPLRSLHYVVEGENLITQAKSTGMGILELSTAFEDLKPDIVITVADRFETMATAIAASYMNINLAHIQGGEITGNIDESVRHAVTKLAHIHFPATALSRDRILKLGEEPWRVHQTGCPSIDLLCQQDLGIGDVFSRYGGVGSGVDPDKPFILVSQHPVTTSYGEAGKQMLETLTALAQLPIQKVLFWPNMDAGSDDASKQVRMFREQGRADGFHFYRGMAPRDYNRLLANAVCAVGNSSSFLREGAFLGLPTVLIGDRQMGREMAANVVQVDYDCDRIKKAVEAQIVHGRYDSDTRYGDGHAGEKMAAVLADIRLDINSRTLL